MNSLNNILIISNNPLSNFQNNGKTLASLISNVKKERIYQIYFSSDCPDYIECTNYYQLTEKQIINSFFKKTTVGKKVEPVSSIQKSSFNPTSSIKKSELIRLLRELIWKTKRWKNKNLIEWVKNAHIKKVFFVGGDCIFAYDVCQYICNLLDVKPMLFITDDYVCGKYINPIKRLRRHIIRNCMKKMIVGCERFFTISEKMSNLYFKIFGRESQIIRNVQYCNISTNNFKCYLPSSKINIIYAGGLHYNRWKILSKCCEAIKEINETYSKNVHLSIFSSQTVDSKIVRLLTIEGASSFSGALSKEELINVYNQANILLFVESFDKNSIESTFLSFSTKISEYLSLGKCIICVGPKESGSIDYLKKCSFCIDAFSDIQAKMTEILIDDDKQKYYGEIASECYKKDFNIKERDLILQEIFG